MKMSPLCFALVLTSSSASIGLRSHRSVWRIRGGSSLETESPAPEWDYVIVGGGAAGKPCPTLLFTFPSTPNDPTPAITTSLQAAFLPAD